MAKACAIAIVLGCCVMVSGCGPNSGIGEPASQDSGAWDSAGGGNGGAVGGFSSGGADGGYNSGGASGSGGVGGAQPSDGSGGATGSGGGIVAGGTGGVPTSALCPSGLPASLSDLAHLANDDTTSTKTPLGTRYDEVAGHIASAEEVSFLHDAQQQPAIPSSTSGLSLKALPVTLYPSLGGAPQPADINQHAIGNCDGDAAYGSLVYANPDFVKRLITDNHDGTFTVAMYDPQGNRLNVSIDNQFLVDGNGNIGAVSGKNGVADWATVLEKTTMKYIEVWPVIGDIGGIGSEHQLPMFTRGGGSIAFARGALSPSELTRVIEASLAEGKLISGGFGVELALANGFKTVTAHGYTVMFPKAPTIMASMRNPWGVAPTDNGYNGSTDGVLDIPPDSTWAGTIDLRVIDPGEACGDGVTAPYAPAQEDVRESPAMLQLPRAR
ncbi:MAG TPA: C2 family cysteine protease [Polyangia bacterium]|jgi:hypothetical protein